MTEPFSNKEEAQHSFELELEKITASKKRPNILMCGYTGSGKTTLANKLFGDQVVPADRIFHGKPGTMEYIAYESPSIKLWDSQGLEPGVLESEFCEKTKVFVRTQQSLKSVDEHIHLVWYCIQGSGAKVTDCDIRLMRDILKNVIVVITKADITKPIQFEMMTERLIEKGVSKSNIIAVAENDESSLKKLIELSEARLPEAYRDAFISAQLLDLDRKKANAQKIIHSAAVAAAVAGASPLPFSDAFIINPTQLAMVAGLAYNYGMTKEIGKLITAPALARMVGIWAATQLTKFIPIAGSIIGASVAFALTEALGHIANDHFISCCDAIIKGLPTPTFVFDSNLFKQLFESSKQKAGAMEKR